jgi:hypothetical protein
MTKQIINVGATANDRNGDSLRAAFQKVNTNFTELYTALGLDVAPLNLGAFEFTNSIISTTDSTAITIDQATTVTSNLTVGGDILPQTANGGNLGSLGKPWNSLYVSNSTIYLGGIPLSVDVNGNLLVDGNLITGGGSSVTTSATAPVGPSVGDLWYDTESGRTYIYYDTSWIDANPVDGTTDIGDWAFRNDIMYSLNGGVIENSDLTHGATAGLTIPTNGDDSPIVLTNAYGNVALVSGASPGALKTWTFGTEGKLTLPAGTTYEYLAAPLTGHGDGLARLDFTLVTDGVSTQWAVASADPAGSGYSPGDTFTFNAAFLGIPGASVTIEVLTVGAGGSVENLGFTSPPLYPADIYRDSPINLQVGAESNRWTFGADGKLTFPDRLSIKDSVIGRTSFNNVTEEIPGGTVSSTTVIENQISINTTDSIFIERTTTQTVNDGVTTTIDVAGSSVVVNSNNAYLKRFVDPDGPNNLSYFQLGVSNSGAIIEAVNEEVAGSTVGRVTVTQGAVDISTSLEGVDKHWTFGTDGSLTLPSQPNLLNDVNQVFTTKIYKDATTPTPAEITAAYEYWLGEQEFYNAIRNEDAIGIAPTTRSWAGLPPWEAYPLIVGFTGPGLPPLPSLAPAAQSATNAYLSWKELVSNLEIVNGNQTISFENTGNLILPSTVSMNGKLSLGPTLGGIHANQDTGIISIGDYIDADTGYGLAPSTTIAIGGAANVFQISTYGPPANTWTFARDGGLTLPQLGSVGVAGVTTADLVTLETTYTDNEGLYQDALTVWMTLDSFTPVWYLLPGRLAYDEMIAWTPPEGVTLPSNLPPVAIACRNAYLAWQEAIANSKLSVKSDTASFEFDSAGKLTLPQGGTIAGGDAAAIQAAYDDWQADEADWQSLITESGNDTNIRPWNFAGPSRAEKQAVLTSMWQTQQSASTLNWVPISASLYNQVRSWLGVTVFQDGYDEWKKLTTSVNITSEDKVWTFDNAGVFKLPNTGIIQTSDKQWTLDTNGRTIFPNGVVPEHSYGAAGDKEGMVVFSDPYIYYCKQDYVDNVTDIWVRVAWTGTNW